MLGSKVVPLLYTLYFMPGFIVIISKYVLTLFFLAPPTPAQPDIKTTTTATTPEVVPGKKFHTFIFYNHALTSDQKCSPVIGFYIHIPYCISCVKDQWKKHVGSCGGRGHKPPREAILNQMRED